MYQILTCKGIVFVFFSMQLPLALFTWRQGAPANQATRQGGLKHHPPLHATHLRGIIGGLSFERQLSTTRKMADKRNVLAASLILFITRYSSGRFSVSKAIILHSTN